MGEGGAFYFVFFEGVHCERVEGIFEWGPSFTELFVRLEAEVFGSVDLTVSEAALAPVELFGVTVSEGVACACGGRGGGGGIGVAVGKVCGGGAGAAGGGGGV